MTPFPWIDVLVIAGLVVINALFAMSEMAIVSARPARLRMLAEQGNRGAVAALALAAEPGRFLSTVQSGITLVGMIAGAYSGVSLGAPLGERLMRLGVPTGWAPTVGFALAIIGTTYVNLVIGELVPKQLALRSAVRIAVVAARPMQVFAQGAGPLVWLLDTSSGALLRLLGGRGARGSEVTAEEIHMIFAEATRSGVIEEEERALMTGIMRLADRPVREQMTPRTEIDSIDRAATVAEIRDIIAESPHSLLPVTDGSSDNLVGVVRVRDLLAALLAGGKADVGALMRKAEIIPDQIDAIEALRMLQQAEVGMGLVHDEYGHLEGIVTPADLLTAIVGDFASHRDEGDVPMIAESEHGAWLLAGALPADALADKLGLTLPETREYATAAGFALSVLKRLPEAGDTFDEQGWHFTITEMDGRKIERIHAAPTAEQKPAEEG